jgi:hypothetical protein
MNEVINKFLQTHGKDAARIVGILAKREKFKKAIETDVGSEIMSDALNRMEGILGKIIEESATPQELAEFRALRSIVDKWQDKLAEYSKAIHKIAANKL